LFGHAISVGREVEEGARRGAGARAIFISCSAKFRWLDKQF
jgi:hypothetical protein